VVKGMEFVRAIQALAARGQQLAPPVRIISVRRADAPSKDIPRNQGDTP